MLRDYAPLLHAAATLGDRGAAMRRAVELLWSAFGEADPASPSRGLLSWVGFYTKAPDAAEMTLACREPKPACSPIGLHGMCGRSWRERCAWVVRDVGALGAGYIACDPRDRSELVVPLLDPAGHCDAVLDADSFQVGAFTRRDAEQMHELCVRLGLSAPNRPLDVRDL